MSGFGIVIKHAFIALIVTAALTLPASISLAGNNPAPCSPSRC